MALTLQSAPTHPGSLTQARAFVDDVVVSGPPEHVDADLEAFLAHLQAAGLPPNRAKTLHWITF